MKMLKWLEQPTDHPCTVTFDYPPGLMFPRPLLDQGPPRVSSPGNPWAIMCPVVPPKGVPYFYLIQLGPSSRELDRILLTDIGRRFFDEQDKVLVALDQFMEQMGVWSPFSKNGELFFPDANDGPKQLLLAVMRSADSGGFGQIGDVVRFLGENYPVHGHAWINLCRRWGYTIDFEPLWAFYPGTSSQSTGYVRADPGHGPPDVLRALLYPPEDSYIGAPPPISDRWFDARDDDGLFIQSNGGPDENEFTLGWTEMEELENGDIVEVEGGEEYIIGTFRRV